MSAGEGGGAAALAGRWAGEFASVVEAMGDVRPEMRVLPAVQELGAAALWWMQPLDADPGAAVWIGAEEETWTALGGAVLAAAGVESGAEEEVKATWIEVVKQSLGALARHIGSKARREIACTGGSEQAPGPGGLAAFQVVAVLPATDLKPLALVFSSELLAILEAAGAPEADSTEPAGEHPAGPPETAFQELGVLLDVEMPVSVSFGSTQVRLRDVLKLITGSIIELDRSISEPVDVIVNNCVIARGEVVVVEGNYGVRIHEVMSRRERLRETRRSLLPLGERSRTAL